VVKATLSRGDCLEILGSSNSLSPKGLSRPYRDSFTRKNTMKVYSRSRCVALLGTEVLLGHFGSPNCNVKDVHENVLPKFMGTYKIKFEGSKRKLMETKYTK